MFNKIFKMLAISLFFVPIMMAGPAYLHKPRITSLKELVICYIKKNWSELKEQVRILPQDLKDEFLKMAVESTNVNPTTSLLSIGAVPYFGPIQEDSYLKVLPKELLTILLLMINQKTHL